MIQDAGGTADALWESSVEWGFDRRIIDRWIDQAANGIAQAILAGCSIIDFDTVMIDGWLPDDVRDALVERTLSHLAKLDFSFLSVPDVRRGSIGPDARSIGAASLPLSQRFLVDRNAIMMPT